MTLKKFILLKLEDIKNLFLVKQEQYGNRDELDNFRIGSLVVNGSATLNEMFEECKAYQRKHIAFVERNGIDTPKMDESLKDIIVYCLIMLYMRELKKNE